MEQENRFVRLLESWQWAQHCNEQEYIDSLEKELLEIYDVDMKNDSDIVLYEYGLI